MSLSIASRASVGSVAQTEEVKAKYKSGLDQRIAGIGSHIEEQAAQLKSSKDFKTHFASKLVEDPSVLALLEKCHLETSDPAQAQAQFRSSILTHVQGAVGALTHKNEAERQVKIDQTMNELMHKLEPHLQGVRDGAQKTSQLERFCSNAHATEMSIRESLTGFIARRIEHRNDGRSTESSKLADEFCGDYKRLTGDKKSEPFLDLWRAHCQASGKMVKPEELKAELFNGLSKQLAEEKGYTPEDANRKAWHLLEGITTPAKAAIASEETYLSGFVFGMAANPEALKAFHHETDVVKSSHMDNSAQMLQLAKASGRASLSPGTNLGSLKVKLEHQLTAEQKHQQAFDELSGLMKENMIKTSGMLKGTSYPSTETVLSKILESKPEIFKDLVHSYFSQNSKSNISEFQREITNKLMVALQTIDSDHYGGDRGLEKANNFYREMIAKLNESASPFLETKTQALREKEDWTVEQPLLEAYRHAKTLAPFVKEAPAKAAAPELPPAPSSQSTKAAAQAMPPAAPPAGEAIAGEETPRARIPLSLGDAIAKKAAAMQQRSENAEPIANSSQPSTEAKAPVLPTRPPMPGNILAGIAGGAGRLRKTPEETKASEETKAAPKPQKQGFNPEDALKVKLKKSEKPAAAPAPQKELSELEKRLAKRRAAESTDSPSSEN